MRRLNSITGKILASYLMVVIITFVMTSLAFYPILVGVLERRAQISLEKEAWEIAFIVESRQSGLLSSQEERLPATILLLGRSVESNYLLVDPNDKITFSTHPEAFSVGQVLSGLPVNIRGEGPVDKSHANYYATQHYFSVEVPIGIIPDVNGTVITFVAVDELRSMYLETLYLIFGNLLIALVSALLIGYFLIGYIVRPLKNLEAYAEAVGNRQFNVRLEAKSGDELSKLASAFNQMADRLKTYDESMRHFFQNASHEMKTPLMSINGYAEGIRDGLFNGPALDNAIEIIHKESLRLRNIVENMIDITILEQPHNNLFLPNNLGSVFNQVIDSVGGYALEKKVEVQLDIKPGTWIVGDWDRLQTLFINLLSNAIRHGRSCVTVQSILSTIDKQVKIIIQDDGPGFTPEDLQHAFDYFYSKAREGSGLGLSIAQKIVDEHTGTIEIRNAPQGGAAVTVTLPAALEESQL